MGTCSACGAQLRPGMTWCWLCLAPIGSSTSQVAPPPIPADDLEPIPEYSRWRAGPTTFGPVGRISITVVVAAIGFLVFWVFRLVDGPLVIADVGIYGVGAYFLLRNVWRRERVA